MSHVWIRFDIVWNEREKDCDGGELREFDMEMVTSGVNSVEYNFGLRCILQLRSKAPTFLMQNDDLHIFLTWEEILVIPLFISTLPKSSSNQGFHKKISYIRRTEKISSI